MQQHALEAVSKTVGCKSLVEWLHGFAGPVWSSRGTAGPAKHSPGSLDSVYETMKQTTPLGVRLKVKTCNNVDDFFFYSMVERCEGGLRAPSSNAYNVSVDALPATESANGLGRSVVKREESRKKKSSVHLTRSVKTSERSLIPDGGARVAKVRRNCQVQGERPVVLLRRRYPGQETGLGPRHGPGCHTTPWLSLQPSTVWATDRIHFFYRQKKPRREVSKITSSRNFQKNTANNSRPPPMRRSPSASRSRSRRSRSRQRRGRRHASTSSSTCSSMSPRRKKTRRTKRKDVRASRPVTSPRPESAGDATSSSPHKDKEMPFCTRKKQMGVLDASRSGRTGGVYLPPFKLAQLDDDEEKNCDVASEVTQRRTWDALRKSLNGLINKVNVTNLSHILPELFHENLVRARGLLVRAIMKAQLASPGFTHIYAALVAVLNTKMPENGELLVKRVVYRFRRAFKRRDKVVAIALVRFIAHLVNQQVVHELLALEVLTLLLANPTDDSVEVAVNFTKECGQILAELCPEGLRAIFERFRGILHEGEIDKRVQYTIEGLFAIRKGGFADYPAVHERLDLVESGDQITHETTLDEEIDCEDKLDVFRFDPDYEKNDQMWTAIRKEILGESDSDSGSGSDDDGENDDDENEVEQPVSTDNNMAIQDYTEQDLVNLRRTIYLTIMSSISHEECAHKLMKLNIRPGQEKEICSMLIECCSQERTYLRYYGLLSERFCRIKREYQDAFDECFAEQYSLIHRLETNKLRNVAKLFAHLLFTDALPWTVFEYINLNEEETTSSSRIFIKILCQELSEHLGLKTLKERFLDKIMQPTFAGLFPTDNPRNTRFAINFFTSIGLGGLTTDLREYLKNAPKIIMEQAKAVADSSGSDSDSDSSSNSSSSSSSSSSDSDSHSDSSSSSSSSSDSSDSD